MSIPLSYQIIPNIIFILSILGILLIILQRLPEAALEEQNSPKEPRADVKLAAKGLPVEALSKVKSTLAYWIKKAWNFILEAKDLKPHAAAGYRMKKIFGGLPVLKKPVVQNLPQTFNEVKNEKYFLDVIKLQPKNLSNYDALGKFYTEQQNFADAKDIYLYLTSHQKANADYHARLAYCLYQLKDFTSAVQSYQKSVSLDSTQPNRYYNLALSQEAAGQMNEAAEALDKALELEPENTKYRQALSKLEKML